MPTVVVGAAVLAFAVGIAAMVHTVMPAGAGDGPGAVSPEYVLEIEMAEIGAEIIDVGDGVLVTGGDDRSAVGEVHEDPGAPG